MSTTAGRQPSDDLVVDRAGHRVLLNGREIELLFQEFELLGFLAAHPCRVFTRKQILERAWSSQQAAAATRTVDVHVHRLRAKLGPVHGQYLVTVRRVGYMFRPPPSAGARRIPGAGIDPMSRPGAAAAPGTLTDPCNL